MSIRYAVIDGCPVPRAYYPVFRKLKAESGCTYNSIYRGGDVAKILHRHGKHTQAELYAMYLRGEGLPANPPTRGTHILKGDGVVGSLYEKLPPWRVGFDVNDDQIAAVKAAALRLGWEVYQPYPSGSEFHHLNFVRRPARWKLLFHAVFGVWPNGHKHRRRKHR